MPSYIRNGCKVEGMRVAGRILVFRRRYSGYCEAVATVTDLKIIKKGVVPLSNEQDLQHTSG
jgi:hypothetical protein